MQLSNKPDKLVLPFAASGAKNTIPAASQIGIVAGKASLTDGFPPLTRTPLSAGGVPPSGLDMNGILYEMSAAIRWANAGGGYAFDGTFAADSNVNGYPIGARVMRSDGKGYWFNTVDNNTTDPENTTAGVAAAAGWVPDFQNGITALTMTSANVTLTPNQYGKPIIIISGVLTANLNLIFPAIGGDWTVINNCTGNFSVTCKTASGTGVVVAINQAFEICGDGTNIYDTDSLRAELAATAANKGAALLAFNAASTFDNWSIGAALVQNGISVKNFPYLAYGNGTNDDTAALNSARDAAIAAGVPLVVPPGNYISSGFALAANLKMVGAGPTLSVITLKNSTNAGLVTSPTVEMNDVHIEGIRFDGNKANNTSGNVLSITGVRTRLFNVAVTNAAENGIVTDWNPSWPNLTRLLGAEGIFTNVTISTCGKSGWVHNAPGDSRFTDVTIIDAGLLTNDTYYGIYLAGNGRFNNLHVWNEYFTTNVPTASCYVGSSGNNFSNCHFEGGTMALNVVGNGNVFSACAYYAPRGTYTIQIPSGTIGNIIHGTIGLGYFAGNPSYKGLLLIGTANIIDLVNLGGGCTLGAVEFGGGAENSNIVRLSGYQGSGVAYVGTPGTLDDVKVEMTGIATYLNKSADIPWTAYTPTVTSGTGTLTTASATGRYTKIGKTVHFQITATITTNGTGATNISATLPFTSSAFQFSCAGRDNTTGKMLQGNILGSSGVVRMFNYDNTYPGANGESLSISGTYEVA